MELIYYNKKYLNCVCIIRSLSLNHHYLMLYIFTLLEAETQDYIREENDDSH